MDRSKLLQRSANKNKEQAKKSLWGILNASVVQLDTMVEYSQNNPTSKDTRCFTGRRYNQRWIGEATL
jgi:hypothetical protein